MLSDVRGAEGQSRREEPVERAVVGLVLRLQRLVVVGAPAEEQRGPVGVAAEKAKFEAAVDAGERRRVSLDEGNVGVVLRLVGVRVVPFDHGGARDDVRGHREERGRREPESEPR